jgi:hypothetical protein
VSTEPEPTAGHPTASSQAPDGANELFEVAVGLDDDRRAALMFGLGILIRAIPQTECLGTAEQQDDLVQLLKVVRRRVIRRQASRHPSATITPPRQRRPGR